MEKSFKTITLRDLDSKENEDIVRILNEFMAYREIKTGQSAIEDLIRSFDFQKSELKSKNTKLLELTEKWENENSKLRDENDNLRSAFSHYNQFSTIARSVNL